MTPERMTDILLSALKCMVVFVLGWMLGKQFGDVLSVVVCAIGLVFGLIAGDLFTVQIRRGQ